MFSNFMFLDQFVLSLSYRANTHTYTHTHKHTHTHTQAHKDSDENSNLFLFAHLRQCPVPLGLKVVNTGFRWSTSDAFSITFMTLLYYSIC